MESSKEKKVRQRAPMKWRVFMGCIIAVALISLVFMWGLSKKKDVSGKVKTHQIDVKKEKYEAGYKATPEYTKKLKDMDREEAKSAAKKGKTHVATVVNDTEQMLNTLDEETNKKEEVKKKKEKKEDRRELLRREKERIRARNERIKEREKISQLYAEAINKEMGKLGEKLEVPKQTTDVFEVYVSEKQKISENSAPVKLAEKKGPLKAGDLIYCQNEVQLNSDVPGPVVLTSVHGVKGKFFGSFQKHDKYLLLELNTFVDENDKNYKIKGYAIDPTTPQYAIRSRVNNRYFSRWASLIAASFLSGWGDAVKESDSQLVVSDGVVTSARPDYDVKDQFWIATGEVADELKKPAKKYFEREATVYLDAYTPVGVLITQG